MLDQLESLIVFSRSATMAEAAGRLRISQSALSKRLTLLEAALGYPLLEYQGRRAVLTEQASSLLGELEPLMAQMNDLLHTAAAPQQVSLSIAFADAIMVSWGATLLVRLKNTFPDINFDIHSHRTATIVERLNRGRYQIGLCTGSVRESASLIVQPLVNEPMAIVVSPAHLDSFRRWQQEPQTKVDIICIEQNSAMWRWLEPWFDTWRLHPKQTVESSVGAARLALEGYGHALVPEGVARAIAPATQWHRLEPNLLTDVKADTLARPCSLVSRKVVLNHPAYKQVFEFINHQVDELISR